MQRRISVCRVVSVLLKFYTSSLQRISLRSQKDSLKHNTFCPLVVEIKHTEVKALRLFGHLGMDISPLTLHHLSCQGSDSYFTLGTEQCILPLHRPFSYTKVTGVFRNWLALSIFVSIQFPSLLRASPLSTLPFGQDAHILAPSKDLVNVPDRSPVLR